MSRQAAEESEKCDVEKFNMPRLEDVHQVLEESVKGGEDAFYLMSLAEKNQATAYRGERKAH